MSFCKTFGLAIFAAVCLLGETTGSAQAQICSGVGLPCSALEWSDGRAVDLGGLPGSTYSEAYGINDAGQAVGYSNIPPYAGLGPFATEATEWSDGKVIDLGGLPGYVISTAYGINDRGQVVGQSAVGSAWDATEWSGGRVINLGALPGSTIPQPRSINDLGQAVGISDALVDGVNIPRFATEWSDGQVIKLRGFAASPFTLASRINDAGQAVGYSEGNTLIPEPSTWAMMLLGFAGLAFAGYRQRSKSRRPDPRALIVLRLACHDP